LPSIVEQMMIIVGDRMDIIFCYDSP